MQSSLDAFNGSEDDSQAPLMANLDQQLKLLKRELKTKDDKIARLTEHAVMMGSHMDRLKGEVSGDMIGACVSLRGYFLCSGWPYVSRGTEQPLLCVE
jgi:hypothetical protein